MNVYKKLTDARERLHALPLKKSGVNSYSGYKYFELSDFMTPALKIFKDVGLLGVVSFSSDFATLTITSIDDGSSIKITSPMGSANIKGCHEVQNIGAVQTYQRRYLWMSALEILENDTLDKEHDPSKPAQKPQTPVRQAIDNQQKIAPSVSVDDAFQAIQASQTPEELYSIKDECLAFPVNSENRYQVHKTFAEKVKGFMQKCQTPEELRALTPLAGVVDEEFKAGLRGVYEQRKSGFQNIVEIII